MSKSPFELPGSELLKKAQDLLQGKKDATDSISKDASLVKGKGGGGGGQEAKKALEDRQASELEPLEIPLEPAATPEEKPKEPEAFLSEGVWVKAKTLFQEVAEITVKLTLPPGKEHLTRIEAELYAKKPAGPELIAKGEGYAQEDGKTLISVPVYPPKGHQGDPVDYFVAVTHKLAKKFLPENLSRTVSEFALKSADHLLIPGINFAVDSSFITPKHAEGLKVLESRFNQWQKEHPKALIVVFGHANPKEKEPKALSERRAESAYAFMTNDVELWDQLYLKEKWDLIALQELLHELGLYPGNPDNKNGKDTRSAFSAIQKKAGLPETGTEDAATRKAIFSEYMKGVHDIHLDATRFRKVSGNPWMGCSHVNRTKATEASLPENRRVAFILIDENKFFPVNFPCQDGDESPCEAQCKKPGKKSMAGIKCSFYDSLVREEPQAPAAQEPAPSGPKIKLKKAQEIAFEVSSVFEGGGYTALAGDADHQGISFGCMQWNIGQGTLQPLWKKFRDHDLKAFQDCFGVHADDLVAVEKVISTSTQTEALVWARSTHTLDGDKVTWKGAWKENLTNLGKVPAFQEIQIAEAGALNHPPTVEIINWLRQELPDLFKVFELRSYVALFDLCNQQGKVSASVFSDVATSYQSSKPTDQNSALKTLCGKRAMTAKTEYRGDCGSRRFGILDGKDTAFPNVQFPAPDLAAVTRVNTKFSLLEPNSLIEDL